MTSRVQQFTADGTFNVPASVSCVLLSMIGGGGGGDNPSGGAGGTCVRMPLKVTPGGTLAIVIGAKGIGSVVTPFECTAGGDTQAGPFVCTGGGAPFLVSGIFPFSGEGGNISGAQPCTSNLDGRMAPQTEGSPDLSIQYGRCARQFWGGASGGGNSGAAKPEGNIGGNSVNFPGAQPGFVPVGGFNAAGGTSSPFGAGVSAANPGTNPTPSTHYGVGGGGYQDGCAGVVWVEWVEP